MMRKNLLVFSIIVTIALLSMPVISSMDISKTDDEDELVTIEVYVKNKDGTPLRNAMVSVTYGYVPLIKQDSGVTKKDGYLKFEGDYQQIGGITVAASKMGYQMRTVSLVNLKSGESYEVDFSLKKFGSPLNKKMIFTSLFDNFP